MRNIYLCLSGTSIYISGENLPTSSLRLNEKEQTTKAAKNPTGKRVNPSERTGSESTSFPHWTYRVLLHSWLNIPGLLW